MYSVWFWLAAMAIVECSCEDRREEQRITVEPSDVTVVVGAHLRLPCTVINRRGDVRWTKDNSDLSVGRDSFLRRLRMVGAHEDFTLEVSPVQLGDEGKYQCKVECGAENQREIRSRHATVTVLAPPRPPKILQGSLWTAKEETEIELECVSEGGKPVPQVTWVDGQGEPFAGSAHQIVEPNRRTFTVKSILKIKLEKSHHDAIVTCRTQNEAARMYRSAEVMLKVLHPPEVWLDVKPSGLIPEGSEVFLSCRAEGYPREMKYKWTMNDESFTEKIRQLVIENITREYHGTVVKCSAENDVGRSAVQKTLQVGYGPTFKTNPTSVSVELGGSVSLFCDATGNPPPNITWTHKNSNIVVGTSSNLTLLIHNDSGGVYDCKASVPGRPDIHAEYMIFIKGHPIAVISRSQEGLGKEVILKCVAFSTPPPSRISWSFQGSYIDSSSREYRITEEMLPNAIKSTLLITRPRTKHFGTYSCSATNSYGNDSAEIVVGVQKNFSIEAFQAALGFLLLLVVMLTAFSVIVRLKNYEKSLTSNSNPDERTKGPGNQVGAPTAAKELTSDDDIQFTETASTEFEGFHHSYFKNGVLVTNCLYDFNCTCPSEIPTTGRFSSTKLPPLPQH